MSALFQDIYAVCKNPLKRRILGYDAQQLRDIERRVCERADLTWVCSEADKTAFQSIEPNGNYEIIPNGVDTAYFLPSNGPTEPDNLAFVGAMAYFPNADAIRYYRESILPIAEDLGVTPKLNVIGKDPPRWLQNSSDNRIKSIGHVDDVRSSICRSSIVIAPLRFGSGTRIKILEAFALGKPVVATSKAAEGIEAVHGQHLYIADDPTDFAKAIVSLMQSESERTRIGASARDLVTNNYDWKFFQERAVETYRQLTPANKLLTQS